MIQRIYIDTSVIGGLFGIEFSENTKPLFDRVENGEFKIVYSEITNDELANAPERVKNYVNLNRIRGYNSVNLRLGHQTLEIRTPKEI